MGLLADEMETTRKQQELIRHFTNLFGYTRESVQKAISEIRKDCDVDEPTDLQKMLWQRADEMQKSLDHIEENIG